MAYAFTCTVQSQVRQGNMQPEHPRSCLRAAVSTAARSMQACSDMSNPVLLIKTGTADVSHPEGVEFIFCRAQHPFVIRLEVVLHLRRSLCKGQGLQHLHISQLHWACARNMARLHPGPLQRSASCHEVDCSGLWKVLLPATGPQSTQHNP